MRKFLVLLRKEIRELLTLQAIAPLLVVIVIFGFIGKTITNVTKSSSQPQPVSVIDQDHTPSSKAVSTVLAASGFKVTASSDSLDATIAAAQTAKGTAVLLIPQGFGSSIGSTSPKPIQTYTLLHNFSTTSSIGTKIVQDALGSLNSYFSDLLIRQHGMTDPAAIKKPLATVSYVQIGDRRAQADPAALTGFVTNQVTFIPILLFYVILFASQIIATAMATEKENKTLETLLSLPVSRQSIIMAKMLAAGIVAALSAVIYLFGYRHYLNTVSGDQSAGSLHAIAAQLGLVFTWQDYVVLGVSLFITILTALSISIILGILAEDVKNVQNLIMPLVTLLVIPYILTLLVDVSSASLPLRVLVYAIPFSHAFLTAPNLFLHNYAAIAWGISYEALWFLAFITIATRIFSTDRIVTMKLSLRRRGLLRRA